MRYGVLAAAAVLPSVPRFSACTAFGFRGCASGRVKIKFIAARFFARHYYIDHIYFSKQQKITGVLLFELTDAARRQYALFPEQSEASTAQRAALMQAMDAINRKMGRETLRLGAAGPKDAGWHVRQDRVSPRATTAWDELPKAFCR